MQNFILGLYLHASVVKRNEGCQEIQVPCGEHQGKEYLALPRDTWGQQYLQSDNCLKAKANKTTQQQFLLNPKLINSLKELHLGSQ